MSEDKKVVWTADNSAGSDILIRNADRDPIAWVYASGWDAKSVRRHRDLIVAAPTMQTEIDALKAQLTKVRDYLVKTWGYNLDENQKPDCGEDELTLGCNKLLNQKPCSTLNCHEWIDKDGPDTCESCHGMKMEHEEGEVENE